MDVDKAVRAYIKMRDTLAEKRREFEAFEADLKAKMKLVENHMLANLNAQGVTSMATAHGTVYRTEDVTPSGSDWDAFYAWVAKHNQFEALERRIKKTFIAEYMAANEGALPPGVSVYSEYHARVRRS